jgi:hypothetical protein
MFSTTWKVEDIFPGWSRTKLEDWGSSDPRFIEMNAAFELGEALGFGNDEEEMRQAEQFFIEMFLEKQRRTELLRGKAAAPKRGAADGGAAPRKAVRDAAAPGGAAHGGVDSGGAAGGRAAPRGAVRGAAAPEGAAHGGAAPGEAVRDAAVFN